MSGDNREWQRRAVVVAGLLAIGAPAHASMLVTLATFNNTNGAYPKDGLIADAAGNLYGTTKGDGSTTYGTVFEIAKTGTTSYGLATYGSPTTITTFNSTNGKSPIGGLVMDASGNLFGTASGGGANSDGTVFEIVKTGSTYASSPTTLAAFTGTNGASLGTAPDAALTIDAAGNLYGTTSAGGSDGQGTVFKIAKSGGTYGAVTTLVNFTGSNGGGPYGGLVADTNGDLFGTASYGASGNGSVFELAKSGSTYTLNTLVGFNGGNGQTPDDTLLIDGTGNLFGTTYNGGSGEEGTVFELKSGSGYALTTLANFTYAGGENPYAGLVANVGGVLYGTTVNGGTSSDGTVFTLSPSSSSGTGYGSLNTLVNFNGTNGKNPYGSVIVDTAGDVFGTTLNGGASGYGTAFEYVVPEPATLPLFGMALLVAGLACRSRQAHRAARPRE